MEQECQGAAAAASFIQPSASVGGSGAPAPPARAPLSLSFGGCAPSAGLPGRVTLEDLFSLILEVKELVEELQSVLTEEVPIPSSLAGAQLPSMSSTTDQQVPFKSSAPMPPAPPPWPTSGLQRPLW